MPDELLFHHRGLTKMLGKCLKDEKVVFLKSLRSTNDYIKQELLNITIFKQ